MDLREASEDRTSLRAANKLLAEEMKSLKSANYTYSQRIKDFDQVRSMNNQDTYFKKVSLRVYKFRREEFVTESN